MMEGNTTVEKLREQTKEEVMDFIRKRLAFDNALFHQLKAYRLNDFERNEEHKRFEFSGYDDKTGSCTIHNQNILNEFADLGIYDYTHYLFLDFYKGHAVLYMRYFHRDKDIVYIEDEYLEFNELGGWGTTELIYLIFEKTIFSGKRTRRRN